MPSSTKKDTSRQTPKHQKTAFVYQNLPAIIWMALIAMLTLTPSNTLTPNTLWGIELDKIAHITLFAVLTHLLTTGFWKQKNNSKINKNAQLYAATTAIAYGGTIEILQNILPIDRTSDLNDFLANNIGTTIGYLTTQLVRKK